MNALTMGLLLLLAAWTVSGEDRTRLPTVFYPRETNPEKWTALDTFVWTPDPFAGYEEYRSQTYRGVGWTGYVLDLDSGSWQVETSTRPVWQHWVVVCVPERLTHATALMYLDGPGNSERPDPELDPAVAMMCSGNTGGLVVYVEQIPNEHLGFAGNPGAESLTEDGMIAFAWRKFLNGSATDPTWLPRLPMTRAAVNAFTAVQDWFSKRFPAQVQPRDYVVAGASKRGWTTWTVAAVDARVAAAIPIVMPIGHVVPNIAAEWRAYGNWSFALEDYVKWGVVGYLFSEPVGLQAIANIVDPIVYINRLTMPVWNIIACGDEFTLPDSSRFWWSQLPGEKHLLAIPNSEHSMVCCALDIVADIISFYHMLVRRVPRPKAVFTVQRAVTGPALISVQASGYPVEAKLWAATTGPTRRDFRLVICRHLPECLQPVVWLPTNLRPVSVANNVTTFRATQSAPAAGWTGFLVELYWKVAVPGVGTVAFRETSEVNVVPDTFPYAQCPPSECNQHGGQQN